jgi:hypothetical protein
MLDSRHQRSRGILAGCAVMIFALHISVFAAAAGRPIISNNTVKTADGQLLRGCHAHIIPNDAIATFFTDLNNVIKLRDQTHMNVIRVAVLTPGWGGFSTVDAKISTVDAIVANCESAGIYCIINCHGPFETDSTKEWDLKHFWRVYAPRYKDKPFVIYELTNETFPGTSPDVLPSNGYTGWPTVAAYIASTAKNVIRPVAPNNLILHCEPVCVTMNWGPYLCNTYAPAAGITWNSGKDAWAFHAYSGTESKYILATQSYRTGIPTVCTEFSFQEEGWTNGVLDGYHYPGEWCERNGMSWMVWQQWQSREADQLKSVMNYLIPDATSKGWSWWNVKVPSVPLNVTAKVLDSYSCSLTWSKSADTGSGIIRYSIYRDDKRIGSVYPSSTLSFTDTGLSANATYSYQLTAATLGDQESPRTAAMPVTTPADNVPPSPALVTGIGDGTKVRVLFSEKVDRTTATTNANYSITAAGGGSVAISTVLLAGDQKTLTVSVAKMTKATQYTLTISNVKDLASPANMIPANSSFPFSYIDGVTRIRFYPRVNEAARMTGGVFEATSGSPSAGPYTVLYTIPGTLFNGWNEVTEAVWLAQTGPANFDRGYRYFRYRGPDGSSCNIAELELYSGTLKLAGAPYGSSGSIGGNDFSKAFDGNTTTYMDYSQPNGGYAGLDMGQRSAAKPSPVRGSNGSGMRIDVRNERTLRILGAPEIGSVLVCLYDLRGSRIRSERLAGSSGSICLDIDVGKTQPAIAPGNYLLSVRAGTAESLQRISWR